jgi:hypothetical protein
VGIRDVCDDGSGAGNYQRFVQYKQAATSVLPRGGPVGGGTIVTIVGVGFDPITTPSSDPPLLPSSVRCLWRCTPRADVGAVCAERGDGAAALLTRPTSVADDEIVCATPSRPSAGFESLGLALNVYDAVGATCDDGLANGDEDGVDCGGGACAPCVPTCHDGVQNGGEAGVDCGGPCPYCVPECSEPNDPDQDCQLPALSEVAPSRGPTGQATLLTVRGHGFRAAGEIISYTKQVLGQDVLMTHNVLPRCSFGDGPARQETPATVLSASELRCYSPPANLVGCHRLLVSLDVCDFDAQVSSNSPRS